MYHRFFITHFIRSQSPSYHFIMSNSSTQSHFSFLIPYTRVPCTLYPKIHYQLLPKKYHTIFYANSLNLLSLMDMCMQPGKLQLIISVGIFVILISSNFQLLLGLKRFTHFHLRTTKVTTATTTTTTTKYNNNSVMTCRLNYNQKTHNHRHFCLAYRSSSS